MGGRHPESVVQEIVRVLAKAKAIGMDLGEEQIGSTSFGG
jgi:hypothetical protein